MVVGGAERLFKAILKNADKTIVSEAYRDLTPYPDTSVYVKLGFKCDKKSEPMLFFYADKTVRKDGKTIITRGVYSRQQFMKHRLPALEGAETQVGKFHFDESKTAVEMLKDIQVYELYNSGCWKFIYEI